MAALSDLNVWVPLLIALILFLLLRGGFRGRALVACVGVTLLVSETVVVQGLKKTIGRPRPKQTQKVRLVQLQPARPKFLALFQKPRVHYSAEWQRGTEGGSFPSAHVANNFIMGTFCALFFRRWGWLYFLMAAAVSYSRIYLGAHWPSDVVSSAFLAIGQALLMAALLEWIWGRAGQRWAPALVARHPRLIAAA